MSAVNFRIKTVQVLELKHLSYQPEETKSSEDKPAQPPTQLKIPASKTTLTTSQEKVPMTSSAATADEEMTKTPLVEMMHGVVTSSADVVTSTTTSQASTPTNDDNKTSCEEGSNNEQPISSQQEKCPKSPSKHSKKAARKIEKVFFVSQNPSYNIYKFLIYFLFFCIKR